MDGRSSRRNDAEGGMNMIKIRVDFYGFFRFKRGVSEWWIFQGDLDLDFNDLRGAKGD
jgi:hypothetical protein